MTTTDVKSKFHTLIDNDEDVDFLEMLMEIVDSERKSNSKDIADELSDNQLNRLRSTVLKYRDGGHFTDNEIVKNRLTKKWLTK
jgi:hypothetical protein